MLNVDTHVFLHAVTGALRPAERRLLSGDPADELIAGTSVVHNVPLVTRDPRLLRSKLIPIAG